MHFRFAPINYKDMKSSDLIVLPDLHLSVFASRFLAFPALRLIEFGNE